jgi:hypothetical protein
MNEKLKTFYLEYSQVNASKKQVWEIVAESMMEAFPYYEFDAKYCHNHYHYCTKLNDHLGDDVSDEDVDHLLQTVAEFGDHDGAWFKIALAMKERTGKLRGAKDLKNWYQNIKQQTYGSDDHSAQLLAQVQQFSAAAAQEAHTEQVSRDILSSITAALASVEAEAVPPPAPAASSSSTDADITAVANAVAAAAAAAALSESAEHAVTTESSPAKEDGAEASNPAGETPAKTE